MRRIDVRLSLAMVLAVAGTIAAGCAQSPIAGPELPSLVKDTRPLLSKEEQAKAIAEMTREKDAAKAAAERQIERR